jgi:hypothetical protein
VSARRLPAWIGLIGIAMLAPGLAACGGATAPPTTTSVATASPSGGGSPLPADDVKAAFLDVVSDPGFSGNATISGTIALAGIEGEVSGQWTFNGPDSHTATTTSLPGSEQANESITLGRKTWERTGDGPWLERDEAPDPHKSFTKVLAALGSLDDEGVQSRDGVDLHHFRPGNGGAFPVDALGIDNPGVKDAKATADFYATNAGVPEIFVFHVTWLQRIGEQDTEVSMDMQMDLDDIGTSQAIEAPAAGEVWTRYGSSLGYAMAHPPDWTVKHTGTKDSYLIDGQAYVYVATQSVPAGEKVSSFRSGLMADYRSRFGSEPDSTESTTIGASPAFRLVYHFRNDAGHDVALVDVGTIHAGKGWEISMLTLAGATEPDDVAVFDDFVSTFRFTD